MDFVPKYFKSHRLSKVLTLEAVRDIKGNVMYAVSVYKGENKVSHYCFYKLSSAIDFINCNYNNELTYVPS